MRCRTALLPVTVLTVIALGLGITAQRVGAQGVLERIKRAAEEAKKAGEQQKQQPPPQQQQPPPQQQQPPQRSNTPGQPQGTVSAPEGDCCSPEALTKIAASAGFVDIVGIKLGMTPEQAYAAVKAFNPRLKIDVMKTRVTSPENPGTYFEVLQGARVHTDPDYLPDGSSDIITILFTLPPGPAFVARVDRVTQFPNTQPVVASNLVDALHKKYGDEPFPSGAGLVWVFDAAGKPVTRPLQGPQVYCANSTGLSNTEAPPYIDISSTRELDSTPVSAACRGITFAAVMPLGEATPRNQQVNRFTVSIHSGGLLYGSRKATHDWLQARADAKAKEQQDAAKARSAPKL